MIGLHFSSSSQDAIDVFMGYSIVNAELVIQISLERILFYFYGNNLSPANSKCLSNENTRLILLLCIRAKEIESV